MGLVDDGAMAVRGNHDNAIGSTAESMNAAAQAAIEWTRGRLGAAQRRFLAELPLTLRTTIASTFIPRPATPRNGAMSRVPPMPRAASRRRRHMHLLRPYPPAGALFDVGGGEDDELRAVVRRVRAIACAAGNGSRSSARWGSPATAIRRPSFAMLDTASNEITYCRVPYDVEAAASRIRANGLPLWLADRLSAGR